jgi:hypothetical protein
MTVMTVIPTQHRKGGFGCKRIPLTTVFTNTASIRNDGQDGQDSQDYQRLRRNNSIVDARKVS